MDSLGIIRVDMEDGSIDYTTNVSTIRRRPRIPWYKKKLVKSKQILILKICVKELKIPWKRHIPWVGGEPDLIVGYDVHSSPDDKNLKLNLIIKKIVILPHWQEKLFGGVFSRVNRVKKATIQFFESKSQIDNILWINWQNNQNPDRRCCSEKQKY